MEKDRIVLPKEISELVGSQGYSVDHIGMSGSEVRIYRDYVLKIQERNEETENEYLMSKWLQGRLPVPSIHSYCVDGDIAYILMSRIEGRMLCEKDVLDDYQSVIKLVSDTLKKLWTIDISDCPGKVSLLSNRLKAARYNVEHNLIELRRMEPETFGKDGFKNPEELLEFLENNRPKEDLVMTHGDFCLPNFMIKDGRISGIIDIGKAGPADRWQDIALALRTLLHNLDGRFFNNVKICDFKKEMLLEELGIEFDAEKYRYYMLLDELF